TQRNPTALHVGRAVVLVMALCVTPFASRAQEVGPQSEDSSLASDTRPQSGTDSVRSSTQKTFFVKRDLVASGIAFAASVAVSSFDLRIAHWARSEGVQGYSSRYDKFSTAT